MLCDNLVAVSRDSFITWLRLILVEMTVSSELWTQLASWTPLSCMWLLFMCIQSPKPHFKSVNRVLVCVLVFTNFKVNWFWHFFLCCFGEINLCPQHKSSFNGKKKRFVNVYTFIQHFSEIIDIKWGGLLSDGVWSLLKSFLKNRNKMFSGCMKFRATLNRSCFLSRSVLHLFEFLGVCWADVNKRQNQEFPQRN